MSNRDWIEVCLLGGELDDASGIDLERQLAHDPDNLKLRITRLGFLLAKDLPRAREVLWLATHHPGIDLGGFTVFRREADPQIYDEIRLAWRGLLERSPENAVYREQAARFATFDDPDYAEAVYREGASREPATPKWPEHLGNLLMRRSRCAADAATAVALAREAVNAFDRAHELESWDFGRHGLQISLARAAVAAELLDVASIAANTVLREAPQFEVTWQYGNAVHWGHIVLGHVARLRGDDDVAAKELGLADRTRGSPQLDSFGPDLELAQRLLDVERTEAVLDYLTQCQRFWQMDRGALGRWISQIASGARPDLQVA